MVVEIPKWGGVGGQGVKEFVQEGGGVLYSLKINTICLARTCFQLMSQGTLHETKCVSLLCTYVSPPQQQDKTLPQRCQNGSDNVL